MVDDYSILIGGKAGDGIDAAGLIIARIFNRLGFRIYIYRDYPSIIRGGHTFSIIRLSKEKIASHKNQVDFVLALNQETINLHRSRLKKDCLFIYDAGEVSGACGAGINFADILKEEGAPSVMRNSCIIGALCKACGIKWEILETVFKKDIPKEIDLNLKVAKRGFDAANELLKIEPLQQKPLPVLLGNEAIGLGLVKAGLKAYVAYPMTPSSGLLHFLASVANDFSLKVVHPESEIAVILMALGFAYAGEKAAVGTSGGGFCLMTEGVSFAGMAGLPVVVVVGQRPGPSTGLPTYSSQTDLHFVLHAGQGEFTRFVAAPADAEEAYYWAAVSLNMAWRYQIPAFILSDKTLSEGTYSFDINLAGRVEEEKIARKFVPDKDAVIKINSYEHDELGITTEDPKITKKMQEKRLQKGQLLSRELEKLNAVGTDAKADSDVVLLCWGSNKGVCVEVGQKLGLRVVHPVVLSPFPLAQYKDAIKGARKIIAVENNATGQLVTLLKIFGLDVDYRILRYDGRPFSVDELEQEVKKVL